MILWSINNENSDTFFASGGSAIGGAGIETSSAHFYVGSGALTVNGISEFKQVDLLFGSGGILLGGKAEAFSTTERLYYKSQDKQTGLSVTFDIRNGTGTLLDQDVPASGEIGTKGIYFLDYQSPVNDDYILIVGKVNNGDYPMSGVKKIGAPTAKIHYAHHDFDTGLTLGYRAYDINDSILQSGNLTEIGSGFYEADVSAIPGTYYFRVFPLTEVVHS